MQTKRDLILMLSSNPMGTARLSLDAEYTRIDTALGAHNDLYELYYRPELGAHQLAGQLMRRQPRIVHFSGHGDEGGRLLLTATDGHSDAADQQAIADIFEVLGCGIKCVVLSACYSASQAQLIAHHVKYVVGMVREIDDQMAMQFAFGFYEAIGFGQPIEAAFRLGLASINLGKLVGAEVPCLYVDGEIRSASQPITHDDATESRDLDGAPQIYLVDLLERKPELCKAMATAAKPSPTDAKQLVAQMLTADAAATDAEKGKALTDLARRFISALKLAKQSEDKELGDQLFELFKRIVPMFAQCYLTSIDKIGAHAWDRLNVTMAEPLMVPLSGRSALDVLIEPGTRDPRPRFAIDAGPESGISRAEAAVTAGEDILARTGALDRVRKQVGAAKVESTQQQIMRINAELGLEMGSGEKSHYFTVVMNTEDPVNLALAKALQKIDRLWVVQSRGDADQNAHDFAVQLRKIYELHDEIIHGP